MLTSHVVADAPWGFRLDEVPFAAFRAVVRGVCWLRLPGAEPLQLVTGDIALLPMGSGHALAGDPAGPLTRLLCGAYPYDRSVAHPLLTPLPPQAALWKTGHIRRLRHRTHAWRAHYQRRRLRDR